VSPEQDPKDVKLDASTPMCEAARAILDSSLRAVRRRAELVREHDRAQDQDVHGLRVATRRASAALSVFRPIVRESDRRRCVRLLRRLRRAAAIARAADVHGGMMVKMLGGATGPRAVACGYALGRIASERAQGRVGLCDAVSRTGAKKIADRDARLLERIRTKPALGAATFGELAQIVITDCFDRLELAMSGDLASLERLHELRLSVKRFRYTIEVLEPCLDPSALDEALARSKALQQRLGDLNDLAELEARLERLAHELEDSERAGEFVAVITGLRVMQGEIDRAMREKRESFMTWWKENGEHAVLASLRSMLLNVRDPESPGESSDPRAGGAPVRHLSRVSKTRDARSGGRP